VMRVLRLKTLADLYLNQLSAQLPAPSQQEIEAYYQANQEKYEAVQLGRIYIPKNAPDPQASTEQKQAYQKKAPEVVDDMEKRAAKGEPIDKLQKEAYTTLGISATPPNTEMNVPRRGTLPPKLDQQVFSTKVGDIFRADDASGYLIIHVDKKEPAPLDSIKEEISRDITRTKVDEKIKELKAPIHVTLDEKFFGQPPAKAPTLQQAVPPR
jgi:PPIC-type PPIASE domain